jgi:hypothetical protein
MQKQRDREDYNEQHYDPYPSTNTIPEIKSRRKKWVGQVARLEEKSVRSFGKRPLGRTNSR